MAFLDELPLDILLTVVQWLNKRLWYELEFCKLLPVASVSTRLRWPLLPLLYRDLVFEFRIVDSSDDELSEAESNTPLNRATRTHHNVALAHSAGCSEHVQRVSLFINRHTTLDDIIRVVRDDMDAGSETKWPHLRSYACNYSHYRFYDDDTLFCSGIFRQLDKELPKPCQASLVVCKVSSGVAPLAYIPPSVSFLTQLTSLRLSCTIKCTDTNRFPQIFAPTLVQLTLDDADPESVWNIFYDGQEGQTVVFARLKRLVIVFADPPYWKQNDDLPPHLQGAISSALTKKSEWAAGATSGNTGCRVPLFPALRTLRCSNMVCDFCGFIYSILCHNSLVSLYVNNLSMHSAVDAEMVKSLEIIKLSAVSWNTDEESTGSAGLYKSAFASLLRTKTNVQRMTVKSCVRDILFQVPPDIGCTNLRLLYLGVEIDFKSMLRLLSNLKHLVELVLDVDYKFGYTLDDEQEDTDEYIDELQPSQAYYPPVSSTLRRFMCRLCTPRVRGCYTASYAFELALHLPALESMTLWVDEEDDMVLIEELLSMFIQEQSGSPYLNNGLLNATAFYYWQEEVAIWERQLYWD